MDTSELIPHLNTRQKIRLELSLTCQPRLNGYLLGLSETLGLMLVFDDFEPDGYTVFRLRDAVSVRSGPFERHWDRMLAGEGLLAGLQAPVPIDLQSIQHAIRSAQEAFGRMILECEDEETTHFLIGSVADIDDLRVWFDHFDGLGVWSDQPAPIVLGEVVILQLETPYIERFWRYLTPRAGAGASTPV